MNKELTGRERLARTFKGEKVDRISVSPFIWANNIYEMFEYVPSIDTNLAPDDFDLPVKYMEYHDYFNFDVLFSPGLLWDKYIPDPDENWEVSVIKEGNADKQKRTTIVKTPEGELKQIQNFNRSSRYLIVFAPEEYLIKTKKDFEKAMGEEVDIWPSEALNEMAYINGKVKGVNEENVIIEMKSDEEISVPYSIINKAKRKL